MEAYEGHPPTPQKEARDVAPEEELSLRGAYGTGRDCAPVKEVRECDPEVYSRTGRAPEKEACVRGAPINRVTLRCM
jgi:hypothetical protein